MNDPKVNELLHTQRIDVEKLSQKELYDSFSALDGQMRVIYNFVLAYMDYVNERHNYTAEESLTMLEAHLLTQICDEPNTTVTALAKAWHRSTSATSQTIRNLIKKDLVYRENSKEDAKVFFLRPTEKGVRVSDAHKRYDTLDTVKTLKTLHHQLDDEEIDALFKGLSFYCQLLYQGKNHK